MAKTLATIQGQVRTYLDEATQSDWTDTEVTREINVGYMKVYTTVVNVFEEYYSTKTTDSSVANQQEYALPSDIYKLRRVEINYEPNNANALPRRGIPVSMDAVLRDLGSSALGISVYRNPAYYLRGNYIGFIPVPSQSGTNNIIFWYIKVISELSSSTDTVDIPFPDRYYDAISLEAAGTLLRKGQQEEVVAQKYLAEAELRRQKMMMELEDRIADDTKQIVDTQGLDVDFSNFSTI